MKVIAIANQKGGVAKTTTASAFAAALHRRNYRVLVVDLDPQGNLSDSVGADSYNSPTVYELLRRQAAAKDVIQKMSCYDVIPANIMLAGVEQELPQLGREQRLRESLEPLKNCYDFIVIDTPPALGILTINAFAAADEIIMPTTASVFAAKGVRQLHDTIFNVQKYCNPNLVVAGILLVRYDARKNNSRDIRAVIEQIGNYMQAPVYQTYIRGAVAVEEAQARAIELHDYKSTATAAEDYEAFTAEYLKGEMNNGKQA